MMRSVPGIRLVAASDLGGYGDGMQVMRDGDALHVAHFGPSGMGTSILDISDRANPKLVCQILEPEDELADRMSKAQL